MAFASIFDCACFKIFKRLVKLILSIWMVGDMVMDGVTTKTYWNMAQVNRSSFSCQPKYRVTSQNSNNLPFT